MHLDSGSGAPTTAARQGLQELTPSTATVPARTARRTAAPARHTATSRPTAPRSDHGYTASNPSAAQIRVPTSTRPIDKPHHAQQISLSVQDTEAHEAVRGIVPADFPGMARRMSPKTQSASTGAGAGTTAYPAPPTIRAISLGCLKIGSLSARSGPRTLFYPLPLWARVDRAEREPGEGSVPHVSPDPLTRLAHSRPLGTLSHKGRGGKRARLAPGKSRLYKRRITHADAWL